MTPEMYESLYGARSFDFVFNDCLFAILGVDPRNPAGYLDELRNTLNQRGNNKKHIFVFVHYPPKGLAEYIEASLPIEKQFFSLLDGYRDVTCFFGDFHGYWRGRRNGVNLIVTGGGGRLKGSRSDWGQLTPAERTPEWRHGENPSAEPWPAMPPGALPQARAALAPARAVSGPP